MLYVIGQLLQVYHQERTNSKYLYAEGLPAMSEMSLCFWIKLEDDDDNREDEWLVRINWTGTNCTHKLSHAHINVYSYTYISSFYIFTFICVYICVHIWTFNVSTVSLTECQWYVYWIKYMQWINASVCGHRWHNVHKEYQGLITQLCWLSNFLDYCSKLTSWVYKCMPRCCI